MPYVIDQRLLALKARLDQHEDERFSPYATRSSGSVRRHGEQRPPDHRQPFAVDGDRILHSRAYTRYIDKTQVFAMVRNDHITHRVLHVQLVAKIARTIGRYLGLNEDLIEAISLGHDIGHAPFGHEGERLLDGLCREHGLPSFQHNLQSVEFLDRIERQGRGWNLSLQTLDGIMCHDGEIHSQRLAPVRGKSFVDFDQEMAAKYADRHVALSPMTLEGCVVRFSDTIAYIGRDIEDAIELKLIRRGDIPAPCRRLFGDTNGAIVFRLVTDLITGSMDNDAICFSEEVSDGLRTLKAFNYERIYLNPAIKQGFDRIAACYRALFETYCAALAAGDRESAVFRDFLDGQHPDTLGEKPQAAMVRDFIAGMTDDYFLLQARRLGCEVPKKA